MRNFTPITCCHIILSYANRPRDSSRELPSRTFELAERGSVGIRGSGRIFTYFLRGNKDASPDMLLGRAANPSQPVTSKTKNKISRKSESKQLWAAVMAIRVPCALNSNIEGFFGSCVQTRAMTRKSAIQQAVSFGPFRKGRFLHQRGLQESERRFNVKS